MGKKVRGGVMPTGPVFILISKKTRATRPSVSDAPPVPMNGAAAPAKAGNATDRGNAGSAQPSKLCGCSGGC